MIASPQNFNSSISSLDGGTPLRRYFSRRSKNVISLHDLPEEPGYIGHWSTWGFVYACIFLTVPIAYIYITFILLRELCVAFPDSLYSGIHHYIPQLAWLVSKMEKSSLIVEIWCVIEGLFYIIMKLQIQWLQLKDPLEASLSAAPMMELRERQLLWNRMMATDDSPLEFVRGWFFDASLDQISRYDVRDFLCWSMFEGRNQEHLTGEETRQLQGFLEELEERVGIYLYGEQTEDDGLESVDESENELDSSSKSMKRQLFPDEPSKPTGKPQKVFRFVEDSHNDEQPNFFSSLYENFKQRREQARHMLENSHPVLDLRNFMVEAEEKTMATATHMYENASTTATHVAANAYDTIIGTGSNMDKQLTAIGHRTQQQLSEISHTTQQQLMDAWNSVKNMKERLETAEFLSAQTKRLKQQLKGYRVLLNRMREMSSSVPSKQMANLMRRITECNESMERLESRAMDAFIQATGMARLSMLGRKEPQRYAKYSSDPLLGVSTYPLGFHLVVLGATEIPLRIMMKNRGFTKLRTGPVNYYFHPGNPPLDDNDEKSPIVFVHGIGIGLIVYIPLIDHLLKTGRPILLPEIPYVSGFRPWQGANSVLPAAVVCSTMTEMLAKHGYLSATFVGHSYGTTWCSYMCKYAPNAIHAVCFLDPVCFCLHMPRLTKQFVYHKPDPGTVSYMVRTDVTVSWTIQRSFPWQKIVLFAEQINIPCCVFLSEMDMLVPSAKVAEYLISKGAPSKNFEAANKDHFAKGDLNVTIFPGDVHGEWTERSDSNPVIVDCVEVLCAKAENKLR